MIGVNSMLIEKLRPTDDDLTEYDPIKLYLELCGRMTQEDFAVVLGVSYRTFQRWLTNGISPDLVAHRRAADLRQKWKIRDGWL